MRKLLDTEIDFISEDIRKRGVFTESLAENLLDHLCCYIEEQPDDGRPFEQVYRQAVESFGHQGLQEIQDETLFLINQKHLSKMKKFMYIAGTFASISLVTGALFKLMHWPGANLLLLSGTLVLTFFFAPVFFYLYFKEQTEKKGKVIAAMGFATAVLLCLGALFKILHWPGAGMIIIGFTLLFIVFLPLYVINGMRNPLTRFTSVSTGFLFACIGGFMMLLSFQQPSKNIEDSYKIIQTNETEMLDKLKSSWAKQNGNPDNDAVSVYAAACEKAVSEIQGTEDGNRIGNGAPLDQASLDALNAKIQKATNELNAASGYSEKLNFTAFIPAQIGSIRYQVIQQECKAYLLAIANHQAK